MLDKKQTNFAMLDAVLLSILGRYYLCFKNVGNYQSLRNHEKRQPDVFLIWTVLF